MKVDVAIVGGGMAGGFLARQLRRALPGLRIALFEKSTAPSYKVGESTVEIASHYIVKRLGLSRYLYEHQLPKNGLRYFFDDESRSTELTAMSEIGTVNLPFHPAFQVDRARLDADLLAMESAAGVDVHLGARVVDLEPGSGGAPHHFTVVEDGRQRRVESRWLVDATGRASLLAHKLGLRTREDHPVRAVWGRFEGIRDLDDWGDPAFADRVRHTTRGLSTVHFCHPGYWIWFIPLRGGVTSVGFVGHPPEDPAAMRTEGGFRAFLERHRGPAELLRDAKPVDTASFKNLSYGTRRFLSGADRWALVGEAAAFADPLYSPGADFIALENDFTTDLVSRDLAGEDPAALAVRAELQDRFLRFRLEATMRLYRGLYGTLGSYELMRLKWDFDVGCYYNLWVSPYMQDLYLDSDFLRQQLRQERFVLRALANFAVLFREVEAHLRARGEYFRANRGRFSHGLEHIPFVEEVGTARPRRQVLERTEALFNSVRSRALALLGRENVAPLPLTSFLVERPLA